MDIAITPVVPSGELVVFRGATLTEALETVMKNASAKSERWGTCLAFGEPGKELVPLGSLVEWEAFLKRHPDTPFSPIGSDGCITFWTPARKECAEQISVAAE
jgi:hypothetical protein